MKTAAKLTTTESFFIKEFMHDGYHLIAYPYYYQSTFVTVCDHPPRKPTFSSPIGSWFTLPPYLSFSACNKTFTFRRADQDAWKAQRDQWLQDAANFRQSKRRLPNGFVLPEIWIDWADIVAKGAALSLKETREIESFWERFGGRLETGRVHVPAGYPLPLPPPPMSDALIAKYRHIYEADALSYKTARYLLEDLRHPFDDVTPKCAEIRQFCGIACGELSAPGSYYARWCEMNIKGWRQPI